MEMQVSDVGGVTKAALQGRLDTAGVGRIETRFAAVVAAKGAPAVVDLSEVTFVASLGIRMLLSTARALSGRGAKMALFGANEEVAEILETAAIDTLIPVAATETEALDIVRG